MASILDQDFGSESEEGDFNPEPVADSDDERKAAPQRVSHKSRSTNGVSGKSRADDGEEESGSERLANGSRRKTSTGQDQDDDEDDLKEDEEKDEGTGARRGQDDDDEEDDEDEDDEDDEDAISVLLSQLPWYYPS